MESFRRALTSGRRLRGIWLASFSHVAAEIAAQCGFDWCLIDLEHGCGGEGDALRMMQALGRSAIYPVVRVPGLRPETISRCLDFGAAGIMLPMAQSAADARAFSAALRYPPLGTRGMSSACRAGGYGRDFDAYFRGEAPVGIVQIESPAALDDLEAIAAIDGVDALFIGHSDLSLQLGVFKDYTSPPMLEAERRVLEACRRHGKAPGALWRRSMDGRSRLSGEGGLFALGTDIEALSRSFQTMIAET
ncbi:MAG: 2-dehydro-3-deoxyglucarate aldolase [Spirochaetes bacterium]|nr:2-dehydro-3-deoxyglucarate aldolase [Spirochaetota bacterium]